MSNNGCFAGLVWGRHPPTSQTSWLAVNQDLHRDASGGCKGGVRVRRLTRKSDWLSKYNACSRVLIHYIGTQTGYSECLLGMRMRIFLLSSKYKSGK